jgi:hypothetical protein
MVSGLYWFAVKDETAMRNGTADDQRERNQDSNRSSGVALAAPGS